MAFASDKGRQGAAGVSTGGYEIDNSLRLNGPNDKYLTKTPSTAGNRKTFTWSIWVKRGSSTQYASNFIVAGSTNNAVFRIQLNYDDGAVSAYDYIYPGGYQWQLQTKAEHRDPSSWYHIVVAYDSTQSVQVDRCRIYINGVDQVGEYQNDWHPPVNYSSHCNTTAQHLVGETISIDGGWDGHLAEIHFVDGAAKTASEFGEFGDYGEWKPIEYEGDHNYTTGGVTGVNGFYLDFKTSGTLGNDAAGSNNWTTNNLASTDQMLDTPTNNFCTWNPIDKIGGTLSEGNLKWVHATNTRDRGTMAFSSGKFYWENCRVVLGAGYHSGIAAEGYDNDYLGYNDHSYMVYENTYLYAKPNAIVGLNLLWGAGTTNDIIQVAVDMDNNKIWFGKNGTWYNSGDPAAGTNATTTILASHTTVTPLITGNAGTIVTNFGQDSSFAGNKTAQGNQDGGGIGDFYYTPPSGFLALCTKNLPDPAVIPSEHFNTVLYTGNGGTQSITAGFQPDLVWTKNRNVSNQWHHLFDAVRGNTKELYSNVTNAEGTDTDKITSFDSSGFSIGADGDVNYSGRTYVAWNWKANGSGVSNTSGSITSTVSANADAGFSIVSYTGDGGTSGPTVGHGLSKAPEMVIIKSRTESDRNWVVYHESIGNTYNLWLNLTGAKNTDGSLFWNSTSPTSTVFTSSYGQINTSGQDYIAYCFHSVDGYSKVGSYTGNGSTDGTFVYTGFRPAYILFKRSDSSGDWLILDNERYGDNRQYGNAVLYAAEGIAEGYQSSRHTELLSNGFKFRTDNAHLNTSGGTYIFIAFAESPFKHTNAR